jgi:acyl-CoA thioesterase I
MVPLRPEGRVHRLAAALLLSATLGTPGPTLAAVSEACRVPDVYLALPALDRTETLIDRRAAVRVAVIGPALDAGEADAAPGPVRNTTPLERELERRLPGTNFSLVEERNVSGLAGEDFEDLRRIVDETRPDLLVWQVGTADAQAVSDVPAFQAVLDAAAAWVEARGVDLILVDPPFVPHVRHERVYRPYVGAIGGMDDEVPVLRRYAATQFWAIQEEKRRAKAPPGTFCTAELLAEAVARAVTR